ncbi:MAG TPA: histidine kinase [Streptosporangiaceae bacterium]|jgi:two-component system sensor histidine kinase DesK
MGLEKLAAGAVQDHAYIWRSAVAACCLVGVFVFYCRAHRGAFREAPRPTRAMVVAGVLAAAAVGLNPIGGEFAAIVWSMGAVPYLSRRAAIGFGAVVVLAPITYIGVLSPAGRCPPVFALNFVSMFFWTAVLCGLVLALRWVWRLTLEFDAGQEARARLAVSEERLRFGRDLHDLLGHRLSVIALKSELSAKIGARDPEAAAAEMRDVRSLAKEALTEVRAAVRGYRALDLDEELASVRAVLEAAGVRCTVDAETAGMPDDARTMLAWALREGVTNALKHSSASFCAITIRGGVLEMRNDGVAPADDGDGSGLRGLRERAGAVGGSITAAAAGGEFLLRAAVPA